MMTWTDDLTGKIANDQRKMHKTSIVEAAIAEAAAFLRDRSHSRQWRSRAALTRLGIAEGDLSRMGERYVYQPLQNGDTYR